jgi:hypothetical protein
MSRAHVTFAPDEFEYSLHRGADGAYTLLQGDEELWCSLDDEDFLDDFADTGPGTPNTDDVVDWLQECGYLPPRVQPEIVAEELDSSEVEDDGDDGGVCEHGIEPDEYCEECDADETDDEL